METSSLTEAQKGTLLGQAYFFRAWCYYNLVKWYGGVPIVKEVLEPTESNYTPRSTTKETINFIVEDLDNAALLLAGETTDGGWKDGSNYGRVTSGTALALKGRVLVLWASPLFNRSNDKSRWTEAYNEMKDDLSVIDACGYGLYSSSNNKNGSDFASVFTQIGKTANREAIFFTLYNTTVILTGIDDAAKNNMWERYIRPDNTGGNGLSPSRMILNMFPMSDGKIPAEANNYTKLETSSETLDTDYPFMNRDRVSIVLSPSQDSVGLITVMPLFITSTIPVTVLTTLTGAMYGMPMLTIRATWRVVTPMVLTTCSMESAGRYSNSILVRKKSDDLDVNGSALYTYNPAGWKSGAGPFYSAAPLIELRYAEVLLNLAEAACMAGDMPYAVQQLQKIRARAGYDSSNNYGLQANLTSG